MASAGSACRAQILLHKVTKKSNKAVFHYRAHIHAPSDQDVPLLCRLWHPEMPGYGAV